MLLRNRLSKSNISVKNDKINKKCSQQQKKKLTQSHVNTGNQSLSEIGSISKNCDTVIQSLSQNVTIEECDKVHSDIGNGGNHSHNTGQSIARISDVTVNGHNETHPPTTSCIEENDFLGLREQCSDKNGNCYPENGSQSVEGQINSPTMSSHADRKSSMAKMSRGTSNWCEKCGNNYTRFYSFRKHMLTYHGQYACRYCKDLFDKILTYQSHIENHVERDKNRCEICDKNFANSSALTKHIASHDHPKKFTCKICGCVFSSHFNLMGHARQHTGEKPFKCQFCEKSFTLKKSCSDHQKSHSNVRPHSCDVCLKSFRHVTDVRRHKLTHSSSKRILCNVCGKTYHFAHKLKLHMTVHQDDVPRHVCSICSKAFKWKSSLVKHAEIHREVKKIICKICQKTFTQHYGLKKHQLTHTGEKPHTCSMCQKKFTSRSNLDRHKNSVHVKLRPFRCEHCDRTFTQKVNLASHQRVACKVHDKMSVLVQKDIPPLCNSSTLKHKEVISKPDLVINPGIDTEVSDSNVTVAEFLESNSEVPNMNNAASVLTGPQAESHLNMDHITFVTSESDIEFSGQSMGPVHKIIVLESTPNSVTLCFQPGQQAIQVFSSETESEKQTL